MGSIAGVQKIADTEHMDAVRLMQNALMDAVETMQRKLAEGVKSMETGSTDIARFMQSDLKDTVILLLNESQGRVINTKLTDGGETDVQTHWRARLHRKQKQQPEIFELRREQSDNELGNEGGMHDHEIVEFLVAGEATRVRPLRWSGCRENKG